MENLLYYLLLGGTYLFALVVRQRLMATYSKYARVSNRAGLSGAQVARGILDANGLRDVQLELARGKLTDHYDPRTRVIRLSIDNARDASVASMAVSAHEAAHALQDKDDYAPLELRTSVYPLVQAGSRWGIPLAILGSRLDRETLRAAALTYVAGTAYTAGFVLLIALDFLRAAGGRPRARSL